MFGAHSKAPVFDAHLIAFRCDVMSQISEGASIYDCAEGKAINNICNQLKFFAAEIEERRFALHEAEGE